jgi:hypothetical protein
LIDPNNYHGIHHLSSDNSLPLTRWSEGRILYLNKPACEVRKPCFYVENPRNVHQRRVFTTTTGKRRAQDCGDAAIQRCGAGAKQEPEPSVRVR